jgi:hypothetical protein
MFLLAGAGKLNYQGTKKWLEDQIDSIDGSPLQVRKRFFVCRSERHLVSDKKMTLAGQFSNVLYISECSFCHLFGFSGCLKGHLHSLLKTTQRGNSNF